MLFAGWFHYHKAAPKLAWFQDVESILNYCLSWRGIRCHRSASTGSLSQPCLR
ncbi:photosystem i p700 chlorophyll a apoprotein a1 [Phtheirospermum japonicum]|uniref:Photosystem i p700 chlorophyll a apoprotein a1 n=1 Tax=Phtheirospermum japonicum TaxID=374723 RepID=A0A830BGJ5_9LAMI|nr:photosystem i p700 chlorophyll a apoprotein a1 [Phtheirospermum japonicum]